MAMIPPRLRNRTCRAASCAAAMLRSSAKRSGSLEPGRALRRLENRVPLVELDLLLGEVADVNGVADANATVTDREFIGAGRTLHVVGFTTMGKYRATGEFNDQNMLERVVTWIPNPVMGDMQVEIRYTDWKDVGNGIKAPFHIHMHQGDHPLVRGMNFMDVQASEVKVNVESAS